MSLLDKLYGEAKGVGSGLEAMNKNLEAMREEDKKYYKTEKSYRNQIQTQAKRERQDRSRLQQNIGETIQKASAVSKPGTDKKTMDILTTALASVVVGVLAAKGLKPSKKKQEEPQPSSPSSAAAATPAPSTPTASPAMAAAAVAVPAPKFKTEDPQLKQQVIEILESYKVENKNLSQRTKKLEVQAAYSKDLKTPKGFQSGGFTGMVPNMGQPAEGDHFYTHVEPGSYIMNRNLVKGMGFQSGGATSAVPVALERGEIALPPGSYDPGLMDFLNYQAFPRFQKGGQRKGNGAPSEDSVRPDLPMDLSKIMGFKKGGKIFLHWAGSKYHGADKAYHATIQGDGSATQRRDYDKFGGGHTSERNEEGIGLSVAAMHNASTNNFGRYPVKTKQWKGLAKLSAKIAKSWGWDSGDINASNVITHAEAGRQGDSKGNYGPVAWGGTGERWDLWKLYEKDSNGSGGPKIRSMIKQAMSGTSGAQAEKDNQELKENKDSATPISQSPESQATPGLAPPSLDLSPEKPEAPANMGFGSGFFGEMMATAVQGAAALTGVGASTLAGILTGGPETLVEGILGGGKAQAKNNEVNNQPTDSSTYRGQGAKAEQRGERERDKTGQRVVKPKPDESNRVITGLKKASHPQAGSGYTIPGMTDYKGRPVVLSAGAMKSFKRMVDDSGGVVKASDVWSSTRSKSHNASVNGVPNSNHLYGNAIDIHNASKTWIKQNGSKYGWKWLNYPGHDGHFDYIGKKTGGVVGKYMKGGKANYSDTFLSLQQHENQYHNDYGGEPIVINTGNDTTRTPGVSMNGGHSNNLPIDLNVRCSSVFSANYRFDERSYNLAMYS